jgi:SAM-dependent methyltransferase
VVNALNPWGPSSRYLDAEPWVLDQIELSDEGIKIGGWALPPISRRAHATFSINGQPFDHLDYPRQIPTFKESLWMRPRAESAGYRAERRLPRSELFRDGYVAMTFQFPGQPIRTPRRPAEVPYHATWYYPDPGQPVALPDAKRRYRVIGSESVEMFTLGGFTDYMRMNALLQDRFQFGYRDCRRILDWGCGCGRVARHFATVPEVEFHGGDIDPDNVAWCRDNLKFGTFHQMPLRPPTGLADGMFDVIYGISVFTHLREDVQFAWLQEVDRLLKPGGIALMTIHGPTTMNYAMMPADSYRIVTQRIAAEGFVITAENDQINEVIDEKDYYVNVAHSRDYIRRQWGRTFEIVDILPAFIWTHDLVVMRKRN